MSPKSAEAVCCRGAGSREPKDVQLQISRWGTLGQGKQLVSHQVGTPMVPAFTVVFRDADTCLAAEVPRPTHTPWSLCLSAVIPSQCRVHFWACLFARAPLPWGHVLPYFPRRALCGKTMRLLSVSALDPASIHRLLRWYLTCPLPMLPPGASGHPSAMPLPLTLSNTGPDSSHPLTTPIPLTSVFPALCHILKVWPAPQKLRDSLLLLFALRAGPPSFSSQAGSESADPRVS